MRSRIVNTDWMKWRISCGFVAAMIVGAGLSGLLAADEHQSACPWIVQPEEPIFGLAADIATYEILFTGQTSDDFFYGFSVADHQLARQLTQEGEIPDLRADGRALRTVEREGVIVYQVSADSIQPRTIYLLAGASPIPNLEQIEARLDPSRPIAVGLRTRGASDLNGPLPRRTVPGIQIVAAASEAKSDERSFTPTTLGSDFMLCAYQVSWN